MYLQSRSLLDYLDLIAKKDSEASMLASDLMIGVTSFFRDRLAWKALKIEVIRKFVRKMTTPRYASGRLPAQQVKRHIQSP